MARGKIAPSELVPYLKEMLVELQLYKFTACQCPDTRPNAMVDRNIWVIECSNPKWYSELIRKYPKKRTKKWNWGRKAKRSLREADSKVTRTDLVRALSRLVSNKSTGSKYINDLIEIARVKSQRDPVSETEEIFWVAFKIALRKEDVGFVEKIPQDLWSSVAAHYKENGTFQDWHRVPF